MAEPGRGPHEENAADRASHRATLVLALLFVLAAVSVSTGLVVYTGWLHDLKDGPFAVLFAVLSTKAALSWLAWKDQDDESYRPPAVGHQPKQD